MKHYTITFRAAHPYPPGWLLHFETPHPPAAGRFLLADLGGPLRTALFPTSRSDQGFTVHVPPGHPATQLLPGTAVDVFGPLGRGFRLSGTTRLLLVAEASLLPPLLPLLQAAPEVAVMIEATTRAQLPPVGRFPPEVELYPVTRDGSSGYLGPLESESPPPAGLERSGPHLIELLAWADRACFAVSLDRYPALAAVVRKARFHPAPDFAQVLAQVPMPCGVGACDVCRVTLPYGERRACVDGPVFNLLAER